MIARKMGLPDEELTQIRAAAAVHDVGKLRVPTETVNKPGKLTSAEFEIIKCHADEGADLVACLGDPGVSAIVRHHHERFDGTGYPSGLRQETDSAWSADHRGCRYVRRDHIGPSLPARRTPQAGHRCPRRGIWQPTGPGCGARVPALLHR